MDEVQVSYGDNGIVTFHFARHTRLDNALMRRAFDVFLQTVVIPANTPRKYPLLIEMPGMLSVSYNAARFTSSDEVVRHIAAFAFVPANNLQHHLVQQYEWHHNPPYPFCICPTRERALEWLGQFVDQRHRGDDPRQPLKDIRKHL
ncbi:MAG: hypothetical protein ACQES2_11125 [Pseudomonadota bacterium]